MKSATKILYRCFSPIISIVINRYGCRNACIAGSIITCFALSCLCFINNLVMFGIIYCLLFSVGLSMIHIASFVTPGLYSKPNQGIRIGVVSAASSLGGILCHLASTYFEDVIEWQKAYISLAIIILICIQCSTFMDPSYVANDSVDWTNHFPGDINNKAQMITIKRDIHNQKLQSVTSHDNELLLNTLEESQKLASLLNNSTFLLICLRNAIAFVASYQLHAFFNDYMIKGL